MLVVTGAAGFIGSCIIRKLNDEGYNYIIAVDDFSREDKKRNLEGKKIQEYVDRKEFFTWLSKNHKLTEFIVHLGARTDTTEFDWRIFQELNLDYSKNIWNACCEYHIPLIYASSAATYGDGESGYDDNHSIIYDLEPLNPYGKSKNDFDKWALQQENTPFFWAGLKFFNVYGPNEYHKGRMASVIMHTFHKIKETGSMSLFKSHKPEYKDGEQQRDFIYVKDVAEIIWFLLNHRKDSGLYNVGTGNARTFLSLAENTFKALDLEPNIGFIDTPEDIRDKYQYYTEANMKKLADIGFNRQFHSLEEGIDDYVRNFLNSNANY